MRDCPSRQAAGILGNSAVPLSKPLLIMGLRTICTSERYEEGQETPT